MGGVYTPPHVLHGIDETRAHIRQVKRILSDWNVPVENHPDDEEADLSDFSHLSAAKLGVTHEYDRKRKSSAIIVLLALLITLSLATTAYLFWGRSNATSAPTAAVIRMDLTTIPTALPIQTVAPTMMATPSQEAQFLSGTSAARPSQSFTYTFPEGTSDWGVYNEADANKWQVIQVGAGNFVYQGTAPSDQDHDITSDPPSNDTITDWQGYAVETKVRVVHSGTNDYVFSMVMRGEDNAPSGCVGYYFLFNTSQAQAEIKLDGPLDQCPPKTLAHGSLPVGGDQWFTVRTEAVGIHLRLFIDDKLILQADDATLPKGYFAVSVVPGATVQFDDIRIWEITE